MYARGDRVHKGRQWRYFCLAIDRLKRVIVTQAKMLNSSFYDRVPNSAVYMLQKCLLFLLRDKVRVVDKSWDAFYAKWKQFLRNFSFGRVLGFHAVGWSDLPAF